MLNDAHLKFMQLYLYSSNQMCFLSLDTLLKSGNYDVIHMYMQNHTNTHTIHLHIPTLMLNHISYKTLNDNDIQQMTTYITH